MYRTEATDVDVHASDAAETVAIRRDPDDSVVVAIVAPTDAARPGGGYERRFHPFETEEVRLYLHGGDDAVTRVGSPGGPISVRVIAGGGRDLVDDSASGGTDIWRDAGEIRVRPGRGTHVRSDLWTNPEPVERAPWLEVRSFGRWSVPGFVGGYSPDFGLLLGYGVTTTTWGFRTEPSASVQVLRGGYAVGDRRGRIDYTGTFRRPASTLVAQLEAYASGIERYNFFGLGNTTPFESHRDRRRTRSDVVSVFPSVRVQRGPRFEVHGGADVRYSRSAAGPGTVLGEQAPAGTGSVGVVRLRGGIAFDSREPDRFPRVDSTGGFGWEQSDRYLRGVRIDASAFVAPAAWSVKEAYGGVEGTTTIYLGGPRVHAAFRAGGRQVTGEYPWFDAAAIGGRLNRGFLTNRFLGDSSVHASAGLGSWVGVMPAVVPTRIGLAAFVDTGRVWLRTESSRALHTSVGAGLMLQPLATPVTLHVLVARSREGTRVLAGVGYPF